MRNSLAIGIAGAVLLFTLSTGYSEQSLQVRAGVHASPAAEDRVDINTASVQDLLKIPGMTRPWAARIIRFRPYRAKNDLIDKGVLSNEVYNRVKDFIIAHRTK